MDIHDIREQNYKLLFVAFANKMRDEQGTDRGALDRFGKFTDTSPRYLSHVNMGRKKLGDEVCRKFEQAHRLPRGWMDHNHAQPAGDAEQEAVKTFVNLYRAAPLEVQALLMRYMADRTATRVSKAAVDTAPPKASKLAQASAVTKDTKPRRKAG
jgi:hypothetical protein